MKLAMHCRTVLIQHLYHRVYYCINMRWQCFWQLHNNRLCVCRGTPLSPSLHVIAENKCLVIEHDPVTRSCAPPLPHWPFCENWWGLRTTLCCVVPCCPFEHWHGSRGSCVHLPLCDKDIFQTEVVQTVVCHFRELSLRTEVEGSVKDECLTNGTSNSSCVSSGTWTEIGRLNRGQASKRFFFSPDTSEKALQLERLLVCQHQRSSVGIHRPGGQRIVCGNTAALPRRDFIQYSSKSTYLRLLGYLYSQCLQ